MFLGEAGSKIPALLFPTNDSKIKQLINRITRSLTYWTSCNVEG